MFGKIAEAQKKAEEIKQKLALIKVTGESGNKGIIVTADANKKICDIQINEAYLTADRREELQDLLLVAIDNAMANAENVSQSEMKNLLGSMLPGIGGMFGK